jgi:hypothetical protein
MSYIFFSNNKWFLHEGALPVKPDDFDQKHLPFYPEMVEQYNQSIADIKAKALEIANPELVGQIAVMPDPVSESVNGTVFYQWPGTFETNYQYKPDKKCDWINCHVSVFQDYKEMKDRARKVAYLVLPPEEK